MSRVEQDALGAVDVPCDSYLGASSARTLFFFESTLEHLHLPKETVAMMLLLKKAYASANSEVLTTEQCNAISEACDIVISAISVPSHREQTDSHQQEAEDEDVNHVRDARLRRDVLRTPLFCTGSGTATNMNVNEVLSILGSELRGIEKSDSKQRLGFLHPNNHINMGQSSNDVFLAACHLSAYRVVSDATMSAVAELVATMEDRCQGMDERAVVMMGRTHLMDAVPLFISQEWSGYISQLRLCMELLQSALRHVVGIPVGATAVGTGLNAREGLAQRVLLQIQRLADIPELCIAKNSFAVLSSVDGLAVVHSALKQVALVMHKIAGDIRMRASGPRGGFNEIKLAPNELGSSIMPHKTNPTQCEAVIQACFHVMGSDSVVSMAAASGQFQLNALRPLVIHHVIQSAKVLADVTRNFSRHCIATLQLNVAVMRCHGENSLANVTALNNVCGYECATQVATHAEQHNCSIAQAVRTMTLRQDATTTTPAVSQNAILAALQPETMATNNYNRNISPSSFSSS